MSVASLTMVVVALDGIDMSSRAASSCRSSAAAAAARAASSISWPASTGFDRRSCAVARPGNRDRGPDELTRYQIGIVFRNSCCCRRFRRRKCRDRDERNRFPRPRQGARPSARTGRPAAAPWASAASAGGERQRVAIARSLPTGCSCRCRTSRPKPAGSARRRRSSRRCCAAPGAGGWSVTRPGAAGCKSPPSVTGGRATAAAS